MFESWEFLIIVIIVILVILLVFRFGFEAKRRDEAQLEKYF
ncbi:MAG: hypothetical protein NTY48_01850 [Candidatus Diapherotrites archaeon]|nr:hypothetical protein [Candidatus Diapherotrites archaeon]